MTRHLQKMSALALLTLAACAQGDTDATTRADLGHEVIITDFTMGPADARPGACYGKDVTPAVIEQITHQKLIKKPEIAPNGNILAPAQYETITENRIVEGREDIFFETPCPPRWTPDFIASVQRALALRGLFEGAPSGVLDDATRRAIRTFQLQEGLNSTILSIESARKLGLVEIDLS
ncbi:MAG: peptidoglycan-binding domain-containing protein [Maritimibacter sp.]